MAWTRHTGHATDLIRCWDTPLDLVATDPPYAFGGYGAEHALGATVAIVLRETAERLRRGCWMVCFCASSWRSIAYVVEACRGIAEPVRIATWTKPTARTKVKPIGWQYASVSLVALRKGPKNDPRLRGNALLDHFCSAPVTNGRRAELPRTVAAWAVQPFVIGGGCFLDPFAGSGALPHAATAAGMNAHGFDIDETADQPRRET